MTLYHNSMVSYQKIGLPTFLPRTLLLFRFQLICVIQRVWISQRNFSLKKIFTASSKSPQANSMQYSKIRCGPWRDRSNLKMGHWTITVSSMLSFIFKRYFLVCVRSLDGQLKCFDIPDLVERAKTRHDGIMAKLKKFSLKPSSAFTAASIKPKERITSFKKALRNRKSKMKNRKSTIL